MGAAHFVAIELNRTFETLRLADVYRTKKTKKHKAKKAGGSSGGDNSTAENTPSGSDDSGPGEEAADGQAQPVPPITRDNFEIMLQNCFLLTANCRYDQGQYADAIAAAYCALLQHHRLALEVDDVPMPTVEALMAQGRKAEVNWGAWLLLAWAYDSLDSSLGAAEFAQHYLSNHDRNDESCQDIVRRHGSVAAQTKSKLAELSKRIEQQREIRRVAVEQIQLTQKMPPPPMNGAKTPAAATAIAAAATLAQRTQQPAPLPPPSLVQHGAAIHGSFASEQEL